MQQNEDEYWENMIKYNTQLNIAYFTVHVYKNFIDVTHFNIIKSSYKNHNPNSSEKNKCTDGRESNDNNY